MNWRKALRWLASRPLERLRERKFLAAKRAYNRAHESEMTRLLRESQERHVRKMLATAPKFAELKTRPRTLEWRKTGPLTEVGTPVDPEYTRADFVLASPGGEALAKLVTDIEIEKVVQAARRDREARKNAEDRA